MENNISVEVVNAEQLSQSGKGICDEAVTITKEIETLFGYIDALEKVWTGNEAKSYIESIRYNRDKLENLISTLNDFGGGIQAAANYYGSR